MTSRERLELLQWLIARSDSTRSSYSLRAGMILTANSAMMVLVAALFNKVVGEHPTCLGVGASAVSALSIVLAMLSAHFALRLLGPVRPQRRIAASNERLFFGVYDTRNRFKKQGNDLPFYDTFMKSSIDELVRYASDELWVVLQHQYNRYSFLAKSLRFLKLAALPLLVAWIAVLVSKATWIQ
jgi:hypothetical protein